MPAPQISRKRIRLDTHKLRTVTVEFAEAERTVMVVDGRYNLNEDSEKTFVNLCYQACRIHKHSHRFVYVESTGLDRKQLRALFERYSADAVVFVDDAPARRWDETIATRLGLLKHTHGIDTILTTPFFKWSHVEGFKKGESGKNLLGFNLKHILSAVRGRNPFRVVDPAELEFPIRIIRTRDQFDAFFAKLVKQPVNCQDVEGKNLNRRTNTLYTIQFGWETNTPDRYVTYILPWHHKDHTWSDHDLAYIRKKLRNYYNTTQAEIVFHFAKFDIGQLMVALDMPIFLPKVGDTMAYQFAIDENYKFLQKFYGLQGAYGLETVEGFFDITRPAGLIAKSDRANMARFSLDEMAKYGAYDVVTPLIMRKRYREWCTDRLVGYRSVEDYTTLVIHQLGVMWKTFALLEYNGMHINVANARQLVQKGNVFETEVAAIMAEINNTKAGRKANAILSKGQGLHGGGIFSSKAANVLSLTKPKHKQVLFGDVLKLEGEIGDNGFLSTDKNFQKRYKDVPEMVLFSRHNKVKTLKQSFADSIIKLTAHSEDFKFDGRLRAQFGFLSVLTGRLGVIKPNCLLPHQKILTERGYVAVKDMVVGDRVWTHEGRWRNVLRVFYKGTEHSQRLILSNGETLDCSLYHIVQTLDGWKRAEELTIGERFVGIARVDGKPEERPSSASLVSQVQQPHQSADRGPFGSEVPEHHSHPIPSHGPTGVSGQETLALQPLQDGSEEPANRKVRRRSESLCRRLRRWLRLPNTRGVGEGQAETCVRTPRRDGESVGAGGSASEVRRTSYQREENRQPVEQLSLNDAKCTSFASYLEKMEATPRDLRFDQPITLVSVEPLGEQPIWDITVEDDETYVSAGITSHNTQNIPVRDDDTYELSKTLVKGIKRNFDVLHGRVMLGSDFSAHEVRIGGVIAKDRMVAKVFVMANEAIRKFRLAGVDVIEAAIQVLAREGDIHISNVRFFFKQDVDKSHVLRYRIKAIVFGTIYGKMAKGLAKELGISVEEAQSLIDVLFERWSGVKTWIDNIHATGKSKFMIHYPNLRIRHLWGYLDDDIWTHHAMDRRGVNSPIQGFASDIGVVSIYESARWKQENIVAKGYELDMINTNVVHDAQYSDVLYEHMPFAVYLTEHAMSTLPMQYYQREFDYDISIPLGYGMEFGRDWASTQEWNFRAEGYHTQKKDKKTGELKRVYEAGLYDMLRDLGKQMDKDHDKVIADARYMMKIRHAELESDPYKMKVNGNSISKLFDRLHMFRDQKIEEDA